MALFSIGLNHTTAPVHIRERLAFGPDIVAAALRSLVEKAGVSEAVILSTCNRTEIYCAGGDCLDDARRWLCQFHGLQAEEVSPYLYAHEGKASVAHAMQVASGLDSLVLGEPQILGQVKTAYQTAADAGTAGKMLSRMFQCAFSVAKQVRTDTAIGNSPVSVAFAAVSLAKQIFADLNNLTALLIGAGETIELTARHLYQNGIGHLIVANRTAERAHRLAEQFDGFAIALTELSGHLAEADIIISSTASPLPVLGKGAVESALKKRRHRPIFMVDIAVPRDIEAEVGALEDVYLYTVDDLEEVIEESIRSRRQAADQAKEIVDRNAEQFMGWVRSLDALDTIQNYRAQADALREEVLRRALRMVENGKPVEEALQFLAHTLTNKLLHTPSTRIREAGSSGQPELLEAVNTLFRPRPVDTKSG
ncbi:MAG: glutamyl-tRNA reductase [Pseudomonadota bacterium]